MRVQARPSHSRTERSGGPEGQVIEEGRGSLPKVGPEGAAMQERFYIAYVWPQQAGRTGIRAFFIDPMGQPYALPNRGGRFSGVSRPPPCRQALPP